MIQCYPSRNYHPSSRSSKASLLIVDTLALVGVYSPRIIFSQGVVLIVSGGLFIFGRTTEKDFGATVFVRCPNCNNETALHLVYRKTWLEYWFIKIFAYRKGYFLVCTVCTRARKLEDEQITSAKRMNEATSAYLDKKLTVEEYKKVLNEERNILLEALGIELSGSP